MQLLILDHETMDAPIVDFEDFALANAGDPELIEDCRCLAKGFGFTVGGGAAPAFTITRWS